VGRKWGDFITGKSARELQGITFRGEADVGEGAKADTSENREKAKRRVVQLARERVTVISQVNETALIRSGCPKHHGGWQGNGKPTGKKRSSRPQTRG